MHFSSLEEVLHSKFRWISQKLRPVASGQHESPEQSHGVTKEINNYY